MTDHEAKPDTSDDRRPLLKLALWWAGLALVGGVALVAVRSGSSDQPIASPPAQESKLSSTPAGGDRTEGSAQPAPSSDTTVSPVSTAPAAEVSTTSTVAPGDLPEDHSTDGGPADWVSEDGCDPGYVGACIPKPPAPFSCDQITETNIRVVGSDAQLLDPDGNGVACENFNNQPNPDRTPEEMAEFEKVD